MVHRQIKYSVHPIQIQELRRVRVKQEDECNSEELVELEAWKLGMGELSSSP